MSHMILRGKVNKFSRKKKRTVNNLLQNNPEYRNIIDYLKISGGERDLDALYAGCVLRYHMKEEYVCRALWNLERNDAVRIEKRWKIDDGKYSPVSYIILNYAV